MEQAQLYQGGWMNYRLPLSKSVMTTFFTNKARLIWYKEGEMCMCILVIIYGAWFTKYFAFDFFLILFSFSFNYLAN